MSADASGTADASGNADASGTADPALPPAIRAQLLDVASAVLGRMAPDDVPLPLRPIARFAPPKRARLGATAILAAVDADETFRGRVAEAVENASPQLAETVAAGGSTAASAPMDVALLAYLSRPDGWQSTCAEAIRRWEDEQGESADADELAAARAETAELRAQVRTAAKGEAARVKQAVADAVAAADERSADVRRRLRTEGEARRAAEREAAALRDQLAAAGAEADRAASAHDAELRRLRSRITELERAGESLRREQRVDRDLDDARLRLLVDTLIDAAAGIRRELSLPASTTLPADAVAGGVAGTSARAISEPAALMRALALPRAHLIIDGYNVTKTGYADLPLAAQRQRLVQALAALAGRVDAEITVAFDGSDGVPVQTPSPRGVRVLFSRSGQIADDLIRDLVAAEPTGRALVVVTSDQAIVTDMRRAGVWTSPSAVLLAAL